MAANAAWVQFLGLLDIDGAKNDEVGADARALKSALTKYCAIRFGTSDITYLVDIINAADVVTAVVTNLQHIDSDAAAIQAAVAAVVV